MTDYSREILNLQRARIDMQSAKKVAEVEVKEQYAARIRDEIKRRTEQAELDFAHELALAVEAGVPQRLIRSEVLRTNVWSRWVYWRDLAQIEPERITVENVKREKARASAPWFWDLDAGTFTVQRNTKGDTIDPPLVYPISTIRERRNGRVLGDTGDDDYEMDVWRSDPGLSREVEKEMRRAIQDGEIDENR